jgi:hypothetical protein
MSRQPWISRARLGLVGARLGLVGARLGLVGARLGLVGALLGPLSALTACNAERQQECEKLKSALKPLESGTPSAETVKRAHDAVAAMTFQDEPLREYAKGAATTLAVLASTLELQADPSSAPDGTNEVVKGKIKDAQGEVAEVTRYCSP